jgi:hypothetical protein
VDRLEDRTVPSTINWINRGIGPIALPQLDRDNFAAVFGNNADLARSVVDTAISEWSRVITNFNQKDNGDNNHIDVTISMSTAAGSSGGGTNVSFGNDNKPRSASITMGRTGDGTNPWYLNPTLFSKDFLGTPTNAFSGSAQAGSPASGQWDLLEAVTHELGHAMGLAANTRINALCKDTGVVDQTSVPSNAGDKTRGHYYAFVGPSVSTLLTSFNSTPGGGGKDTGGGEHFAAPGDARYPISFNGKSFVGTDDLMTPYYGQGQRRIVSYNDAYVLHDAMGYDVQNPDVALGDFYAVLDETGKLTVRGGPKGPNGDSLTVEVNSNQQYMQAVVTVSNVTPGTSPRNSELYGKVSIPVNSVKSIAVVGGGSSTTVAILTAGCGAPLSITNTGSLTINVDDNGGPVTITGAGPSTKVTVGSIGGHVLTKILAGVSVSTTAGPIDLTVDDFGDTTGRTVTLSDTSISYGGPQISYPRNGMNSLTLIGGTTTSGGGYQYTISDTPAAPAVTTLRTRGSYDQVKVLGTSGTLNIDSKNTSAVYVGDNGRLTRILGSVDITNSQVNGTDLLIFNSNDTGERTVTLGRTQVSFGGPGINYAANALNILELHGGTGASVYTVTGTPDAPAGTNLQTQGDGDQVQILANSGPFSFSDRSHSTVSIGNKGRLTDILKDVIIGGPVAPTSLVIDDSADPGSPTATITSSTVSYGNPNATIRFTNLDSLTVRGGPGGGTFNVLNTPANAVTTISGPQNSAVNITNVQATTGALTVSTHGPDAVNIGSPGNSLDQIKGVVTVDIVVLGVGLQVIDSSAAGAHVYSLTSSSLSRDGAPVINFGPTFKAGLSLTGSSAGGSTLNIQGTPPAVPPNGDTFQTHTGDVVNIGSAGNTISGFGTIAISGGAMITLNDQGETTAQTYTFSRAFVATFTTTGTMVNYSSAPQVILNSGSGGNTINVQSTLAGTSVTVNAGSGNDAITIGNPANRLDDIKGPLTINGQDGTNTLIINDQGTTSSRGYEMYATMVKRIVNPSVAPVVYDAVVNYANVQTLNVNGSSGGNIWYIYGTPAGTNTNLNSGAVAGTSADEFEIGADSNALLGPLALHVQPGTNSYMVYYDYQNAAAQTYTLTAGTVSRSGLAPVTYDSLAEVILYAASVGGNSINVPSLSAGVFDNIATADGDTVTIGANKTLAAVLGPVAVGPSKDNSSGSVVIDDSGNATPPARPITLSNDPDYGLHIDGLVPAAIYLRAAQNTTYNTTLLTGPGDQTFNVQSVPIGVAIALDAGSDTNTLDYTGYTGNVVVDLPLGMATGFSSISNIYRVKGASGGAPGSYNILVGFGGNVLTGGTGRRNLLIAGHLPSTLIGGDAEDILIGGTTAYDMDLASLQAIMKYWAGSADDLPTRIANLTSGTGVPLLDATTVQGNGGGNLLRGSGAWALIFSDGMDTDPNDPASGLEPASVVIVITP